MSPATDVGRSTVFTDLSDGRPPLPPPRQQRRAPAPPPAETATASIEDVIGRLRLDEARKTTTATAAAATAAATAAAVGDDSSARRVPRMGTRLCTDFTASSRFTEPAPPPSTRLGPDNGHSAVSAGVTSAVDMADGRGAVSGISRSTQTCDSDMTSYRLCADVMYTNRANLRHTITVQQRLFRQQLADRQASTRTPAAAAAERPCTVSGDAPPSGGKLEWVVRRRSDGSRYVTRRPVRSTAAWDTTTTTTDDDDASQRPRTGRYWTRDERRQHVAERRQRQAMKKTTSRCPAEQNGLAAELAAISRHRQTPLLSVATV